MHARRMLAPGLAAVAALVGAGCSFGGGFGDGYRCGEGDVCPTGTTCVDGYCVAAPPDAAPDDDGGAMPDAEPGQPRCGTLSRLSDSFSDGVSGELWDPFEAVGANLVETSGQLRIQLAAGSDDPFAGYTSVYYYDLTDGAIEVSVPQVGGQNTILEVRNQDGERAQLVVEDDDVIAALFDTASAGERARIPYDPVAHARWRLREAGGTMYWETSPDGAAWTELWSEPVPFSIEHVRGVVSAGGQLLAASEARFDDVNESAPAGRFCATASLVDGFDATPLGPRWESSSDGVCTITESGGELVMAFTGAGDSFCGVGSWHLLDLRDSEVVLDATTVPQQANFVSYFQVIRVGDDDTHLEISREGSALGFEQSVDTINTTSGSLTYSAASHRYWKLRERAGTVYFETSADGAAWTTRGEATAGFDLGAVRIVVGAGHYGAGGNPTAARFGRIN